jgi:hypothetical protein
MWTRKGADELNVHFRGKTYTAWYEIRRAAIEIMNLEIPIVCNAFLYHVIQALKSHPGYGNCYHNNAYAIKVAQDNIIGEILYHDQNVTNLTFYYRTGLPGCESTYADLMKASRRIQELDRTAGLEWTDPNDTAAHVGNCKACCMRMMYLSCRRCCCPLLNH